LRQAGMLRSVPVGGGACPLRWRRDRGGLSVLEGARATTSERRRPQLLLRPLNASTEGGGEPTPTGAPASTREFDYNPEKGQELSKLGGGGLLVVVAIYGFSRLLARRATYFSKVRLASRGEDEDLLSRRLDERKESSDSALAGKGPPAEKKGPKDVFTNAAVAGAIFLALYIISSKIDASFSSVDLPEQYTVRQISVTLKTIVVGLSYLACFVYGANALGLFLLGVDMVRNPDKHRDLEEEEEEE